MAALRFAPTAQVELLTKCTFEADSHNLLSASLAGNVVLLVGLVRIVGCRVAVGEDERLELAERVVKLLPRI